MRKAPRGDPEQFRPKLPSGTLTRYGLSPATSSAWQAIASVDFSAIEARCQELEATGGEVTLVEFVRLGRAAKRRQRKVPATSTESRLKWALAVLGRVRTVSTRREAEAVWRLCELTQRWRSQMGWGSSRPADSGMRLVERELRCSLCGREPESRCAAPGVSRERPGFVTDGRQASSGLAQSGSGLRTHAGTERH